MVTVRRSVSLKPHTGTFADRRDAHNRTPGHSHQYTGTSFPFPSDADISNTHGKMTIKRQILCVTMNTVAIWHMPVMWFLCKLEGHRQLFANIIILTHWGRVTHICVSELTVIGSDNGLSPGRRQAIIWTNDGILLIRPLNKLQWNLFGIQTFPFNKMHLKMSSAKWRPFSLGLNVF